MINPSWYPSKRQLRQFAVISLVGFGVAGMVARLQLGLDVVSVVLWSVGGLTFLAGILKPHVVLPVYLGLMALSFPIGWLVSNVFLRVLFNGVMTLLGLIFRALGRDPLRLKKPKVRSYWLSHEQRTDAQSYYRQA